MKKIISVLLATVIMASSVVMAFAKPIIKGDTNNDGIVSAVDAKSILNVVAGEKIVTNNEIALYDVDENGLVTAVDARMVLKIVAGLDADSTDKPTTETPPTNEPTIEEPTTEKITEEERMMRLLEEEFLKLVNAERKKNGRCELKVNEVLHKAARLRAEECLVKFSHTRPNGESYKSILKGDLSYKWSHIAENIAWFYESSYSTTDWTRVLTDQDMKDYAKHFFSQFKNSSQHYANILYTDFTETGFGVVITITSQGTLKVACSNLFGTPA